MKNVGDPLPAGKYAVGSASVGWTVDPFIFPYIHGPGHDQ